MINGSDPQHLCGGANCNGMGWCNPTLLPGASCVFPSEFLAATCAAATPSCLTSLTNGDVTQNNGWLAWTAPSSRTYYATTNGCEFDTVLDLYTDCTSTIPEVLQQPMTTVVLVLAPLSLLSLHKEQLTTSTFVPSVAVALLVVLVSRCVAVIPARGQARASMPRSRPVQLGVTAIAVMVSVVILLVDHSWVPSV